MRVERSGEELVGGVLGLMRKGWREVLGLWGLFLVGTSVAAAPQDGKRENRGSGSEPVHVTIELSWGVLRTGVLGGAGIEGEEAVPDVLLELTEGRVVEAIAWPPGEWGEGSSLSSMGPGPEGSWRLGRAREGRVRARLEAPLEASLTVRDGNQVVKVPLAAILERAYRTPATAPLTVSVERLAWDSLTVDLGSTAGDGIVVPGAEVPVSVALNILGPEAAEVSVRFSAVLRAAQSGEVLSRDEQQETLRTNRSQPAVRVLRLRAPRSEGTYVVEIHATWEPVGRDSSRLGWIMRRRKPAAVVNASSRRVTLTVLEPTAQPAAMAGRPSAREGRKGEPEVDSVDLTRSRSYRPLASGRSPLAEPGRSSWGVPAEALIAPSRRDRLRGWFLRTGAEAAKLDPADGSGLAWSAVGLKVAHPDRPHRLTLKVKEGEPAALGVALIEPGDERPDRRSRVLLDACVSGPPILENGPPLVFSWLVWPGSTEAVLVLVNRDTEAAVRLGTVTLTELDDVPPAHAVHEPDKPPARTLGLYLTGTHALDPFRGDSGPSGALATARNLVKYMGYCGATAVVVPEELCDRSRRRALSGQVEEDSTGPDRLDVLRRVLERQECSLWLELSFDGSSPLPGLPPPDSEEAIRRGLVRLNGQGHAEGPTYHPLHPEVREAMKRRVVDALTRSRTAAVAGAPGAPTTTGLVIRLGPGPTLLGTPDTGIDDITYERFVRETFATETARGIPGSGTDDPERFAVRLRYLAGVGRMPWLTWRSRAMAALYEELSAAAREASAGTVLAIVTPGLDGGPAGREARRVDLAGLAPGEAWRSVGLDLQGWPSSPTTPVLLRGVSLSTDALAHDLATSPDLDAIVAGRTQRGVLLTIDGGSPERRPTASSQRPSPEVAGASGAERGTAPRGATIWLSALPLGDGPEADEPLGHALAALDAQWVFLSARAVAGHEERLRQFAGVFRALPASPAGPPGPSPDPHSLPFGVAIRKIGDAAQTYLEIANDSPYPIRLACLLEAPVSAAVDDLGRGLRLAPTPEAGGRSLVLDFLPFGVSAIRIGAPGVQVASVTPYPSEAVLTSMQARSRELSALLARLNRGLAGSVAEPPNPGFEPDSGRTTRPESPFDPSDPMPPLPGEVDPALKPTGTAANAAGVLNGWQVESVKPGPEAGAATVVIDKKDPHSGEGSLRLSSAAGSASVLSDPFVPDALSSLTIEAFFRSAPTDAVIRVWIEGESRGQPYVRRSELGVTTRWEGRAVRASDLPLGGLDSARLRFELMTPGVLWIDDLHTLGDATSKSARLNARRALLAALQAYREQRYADFARLAASHWVRQSGVSVYARLARGSDAATRTGRTPDAAASALSSDRKLR
jgi:hypothetical protein